MESEEQEEGNIFEIVISYDETTYQMLTVRASSENAAKENIRKEFEDKAKENPISNLKFRSIEQITRPPTFN